MRRRSISKSTTSNYITTTGRQEGQKSVYLKNKKKQKLLPIFNSKNTKLDRCVGVVSCPHFDLRDCKRDTCRCCGGPSSQTASPPLAAHGVAAKNGLAHHPLPLIPHDLQLLVPVGASPTVRHSAICPSDIIRKPSHIVPLVL